jgi:hypothetical protein
MSISGRRSISRRRIGRRRRSPPRSRLDHGPAAWSAGCVLHALLRRRPGCGTGAGVEPFTLLRRVIGRPLVCSEARCRAGGPTATPHTLHSSETTTTAPTQSLTPRPAPDLAMGADRHVCCHAPRALASPQQQARVSRWSPCIRLGLLSQYRRPSSTNYALAGAAKT